MIVLPEQAPVPFGGRVVAFNGRLPDGRPAILAHLFTDRPAPLTFILAFSVAHARGTFGTRLVATVPAKTRRTAHITAFSLRLHRVYTVDGERRSYLSAGCPAPAGFSTATFPLLRASYGFVGERDVSDTLVRTCRTGGLEAESRSNPLKVSFLSGEAGAMTKVPAVPASLPARRLVGLIAAMVALVGLAVPALAGARPAADGCRSPRSSPSRSPRSASPATRRSRSSPSPRRSTPTAAKRRRNRRSARPSSPTPARKSAASPYEYGIGEVEVTVEQYVAFLNTVDPFGRNGLGLYSENESGAAWPRFGQIDYSALATAGKHYTAAAPEWNDKPYGFADFLRAARFDNSVANGKVLSKTESVRGSGNEEDRYVTYKVRLSRRTGTGMYDMHKRAPVRTAETGFVIPSQNEWIKAAYFDRTGGGTYSYWWYPTNVGSPFIEDTGPTQVKLDPTNGDVVNQGEGPLANFRAGGETAAPYWCPSNQTEEACKTVNPLHMPAKAYEKAFAGSLNTVGQAATLGPWGTLEQGGNAVEWTDTITPAPFGAKGHRVWRRLHGGVPNAPLYQLWLSAVGLQPQDNAFFVKTYPWLGFRLGVIGSLVNGSGAK